MVLAHCERMQNNPKDNSASTLSARISLAAGNAIVVTAVGRRHGIGDSAKIIVSRVKAHAQPEVIDSCTHTQRLSLPPFPSSLHSAKPPPSTSAPPDASWKLSTARKWCAACYDTVHIGETRLVQLCSDLFQSQIIRGKSAYI